MALPSTGAISMLQVRTELSGTGAISLNDSNVRSLFGVASGQISLSDGLGKSAVVPPTSGTTYTYYTFDQAVVSPSATPTLQTVVTKTYSYSASGNLTLEVQAEGGTIVLSRSLIPVRSKVAWTKNDVTVISIVSPSSNGSYSSVVGTDISISNGDVLKLTQEGDAVNLAYDTRGWIKTGNDMSSYTLF